MVNKIWKEITNYPNYKVSNTGEVKSLNYNHTKEEKVLSPLMLKSGYKMVVLVNNSGRKHFLIHRLVAEAFIPNPNNLPQVNHKDENRINNRVDNLEWCSCSYNINYGSSNSKRANRLSILKRKRVKQLLLDGTIVRVFNSVIEAESIVKIKGIGRCCNGQRLTAGGYKWEWE